MSKLVDIMKDMNEQITKLACAVTEAVHSSSDDDHDQTRASSYSNRNSNAHSNANSTPKSVSNPSDNQANVTRMSEQEDKAKDSQFITDNTQPLSHKAISILEEQDTESTDMRTEIIIEDEDTLSELSEAQNNDNDRYSSCINSPSRSECENESELNLNMNRAPNPRSYLRKDLRDYLLSKVLSVDD